MSVRSSLRASQENKIFDIIDSTSNKKIAENVLLLFPDKYCSKYDQMEQAVAFVQKQKSEDLAAVIIQRNFRMFRVRRIYLVLIKVFRQIRNMREAPPFYLLLLNTNIPRKNRDMAFSKMIETHIRWRLHFPLKSPSNADVFRVTDQAFLPVSVNQQNLVNFVKKVYAESLRNILCEWRLIARRQRKVQKLTYEEAQRHQFRSLFVPFHQWLRWSDRRRGKPSRTIPHIPEWEHHLSVKAARKAKIERALEFRKDVLRHRCITAFSAMVAKKRTNQLAIQNADAFRKRHIVRFAISAWIKTIVIDQTSSSVKRSVMSRWMQITKRHKHFDRLLSIFQNRHALYQKRRLLSVFIKNRKINKIQRVFGYCQIQLKPSLALWFIWTLRQKHDFAPLCLAFHSWMTYVRRRRQWHRFVFENIRVTQYDQLKRKALSCLTSGSIPIREIPISLVSKRFQQQTVELYSQVMSTNPKQGIYLLSDFTPSKEGSGIQRDREKFFEMWEKLDQQNDLLMRVAIINAAKREQIKNFTKSQQDKRTKTKIEQAMTFFERCGFASDVKFEKVLKIITENQKVSRSNRQRCIHRDLALLHAHESHSAARDLNKVTPLFRVNDSFVMFTKIREMNDQIRESHQPPSQISFVGLKFPEPNEPSFFRINGCKSRLPAFRAQLELLRELLKNNLEKAKFGSSGQSRFEHFMTGRGIASNTRTMLRTETFDHKKSDKTSVNGVEPLLSSNFPNTFRRPRIIGTGAIRDTENGEECMGDSIEEDEFSDVESEQSKPSLLDAQSSMFFRSVASFSSLLSQSLASFAQSAREETLEEVEETEEEEDINEVKEEDIKVSDEETPEIEGKGFEGSITKTVGGVESPNVAKKYRQFLSILFGRPMRDVSGANLNNMRRKLINEYRNRKQSNASHGILTGPVFLPVSGLAERYRSDRLGEDTDSPREIRSQKHERITSDDSTFSVVYKSRRYRKVVRDEDPLTSRSSLFDDEEPVIPPQKETLETKAEEEEEEITEEYQDSSEKPMEKLKKSTPFTNIGTPSALKTLDKVVFSYLEKYVKNDMDDENYVDLSADETSQNEVPEQVQTIQKKRLWNPPAPFPGYVPQTKRLPRKVIKPEKGRPLVIHSSLSQTEEMETIIDEARRYNKLFYTNGKSIQYHKTKKPDPLKPILRQSYQAVLEPLKPESSVVVDIKNIPVAPQKPQKVHQENFDYLHKAPKQAREAEDIRTDFSNLKSLVGQMISMISSAQDDPREFERLRRRARMIRKRPTFVGLISRQKASPDTLATRLQRVYVKYTRKKNTKEAADELLHLIQENPDYASILMDAIDETVKEEQEYMKIKLPSRLVEKPKVSPAMAVHFLDLKWLPEAPSYKAAVLQYKARDKELNAIIAPNYETKRPSHRHRRRPTIIKTKNIDDILSGYSLEELIAVTPYVFSEAEIDEFLEENK